MNDADQKAKTRNREIAENESERQTIGDIRVSVWAVAIVVLLGLVIVGWVLISGSSSSSSVGQINRFVLDGR
jgi:cell division septal protein FtsQ